MMQRDINARAYNALALGIVDGFPTKTKMADKSNHCSTTIKSETLPSLCDYQPLKDCLERNKGDRAKCMKEWEEFQRSCSERKR